ncbi:hypothetical protein V8C37DRAFT_413612 [Trichoderma ceciliae]
MSTKIMNIINKLSISNALTIKNSFPESNILRACYEEYIDPVLYFQDIFDYLITLISRALEFFLPGSICPELDWDFYILVYKESVVNINIDVNIIALDLFNYSRATISWLMLESLVMWVTSLGDGLASCILRKELYAIAHAYNQRKEVFIDINTFKMNLDADKNYNDPLGRSFSILHSTIITLRGCEKIQLIICSYYTGIKSYISFIRDFYTSHRYASEKNNALISSAIQKYKTRGFEFLNAKDSDVQVRALTDNDAYIVNYGYIYRKYIPEYCSSILDDWLYKRRENINAISWIEYNGRILSFSSLLERFYQTSNITFAGSRQQLPMSARRCLGNIIAVNTKNPNKLRSAGYYSAVGKNVMKHGWEMQTVAMLGTVSCFFKDATPWSWTL